MNLELDHPFSCSDGRTRRENVHSVACQPAIEVIGGDAKEIVRLTTKHRKRRRNKDGSFRWYAVYEVPDDPRVPKRLRGATTSLRHHVNQEDIDRGLHRSEHLHMFTNHDPEHKKLYGVRNDTESRHKLLKDKLSMGKISPRVGLLKTTIALMARCLMQNSNNYPPDTLRT